MPPVVDKKYSLVNMIGTVLSKLFALEAGHSKLDCDHLLVEIAVEEGKLKTIKFLSSAHAWTTQVYAHLKL